jgi:ribosomal protein S14
MIKHLRADKIQRGFVKKTELNILLFKTLLTLHNPMLDRISLRYLYKDLYMLINRFASRARTNGVCVLTGRTRSVYRKAFRMTRMQIREKTNAG